MDVCYNAEKGIYEDAFGVTISHIRTGLSEMYLGKAAFSSSKQLFLTMGHELNHVAMNFFGLPQSEAFCYNWEVEAGMVNHFTQNQMDIPMKQSIKLGWFSDTAKYPNFGINLNYSPY